MRPILQTDCSETLGSKVQPVVSTKYSCNETILTGESVFPIWVRTAVLKIKF